MVLPNGVGPEAPYSLVDMEGPNRMRAETFGEVREVTAEVAKKAWDEDAGDWVVSHHVIDNRRTRQTEIALPIRYMDRCKLLRNIIVL